MYALSGICSYKKSRHLVLREVYHATGLPHMTPHSAWVAEFFVLFLHLSYMSPPNQLTTKILPGFCFYSVIKKAVFIVPEGMPLHKEKNLFILPGRQKQQGCVQCLQMQKSCVYCTRGCAMMLRLSRPTTWNFVYKNHSWGPSCQNRRQLF